MDQDIEIINANTRNEKIKNFFISYKKQLIVILIIIFLCLFGFFFYEYYKSSQKEQLSNKYNQLVINYNSEKNKKIENDLIEIIYSKDKTYSPLAFYFLIDNNLINSKEEINSYFNILIEEVALDKEIKNLTIYKKALFNSDFANENELLNILNPLIKSKSVWKAHALYLMAEYYLAKNQKQKSKEFFNSIVGLENISSKIKMESQKRLRSEFSE
tara:strand:- start:1437 stop:2081 length:645 start_codon:yes stop_codon:yes gene_type:complete